MTDSLFQKWRHFLLYQQGASPRTAAAYQGDLELLLQYLQLPDEQSLLLVDTEQLGDFITWLAEERGCGHNAVARRVATLRSFFAWLVQTGLIDVSPAEILRAPRRGRRRLPAFLNEEQVSALLAQPDRTRKSGIRNYTILILLLNTGLRLAELRSLKVNSIDTGERWVLQVVGKGDKSRRVPLNIAAQAALVAWLPYAQKVNPSPNAWLFPGRGRKTPLTGRAIQIMLSRYAEKAGLSGHVTPHTLRHTFATMLQRNNVGLRTIQELLGHESVATTQIYTHVDDRARGEAVDLLD
jgi:integrase/recombinase XerD